MHELALASSVLDIVETYRARHNFQKVHSLTLSFGELGGINKKSLQFAFQTLSEGTIAEGARLIFVHMPAVVSCSTCGNTFQGAAVPSSCPACGSEDLYLSAGFEPLKLLELDVE